MNAPDQLTEAELQAASRLLLALAKADPTVRVMANRLAARLGGEAQWLRYVAGQQPVAGHFHHGATR